jgi:hypothetical protein
MDNERYDSDMYDIEPLENIPDQKHDCKVPEGLMITGIVGAVASVMLTAPVIALGFIGLWCVGVVAHYNNDECDVCVPRGLKND